MAEKINTMEEIFKKYSDVPPTILIKTELLRQGVNFTKAALEAVASAKEKILFKGYFVFSEDTLTEEDVAEEQKIPWYIILSDGTMVFTRMNPKSPYFIDLVDNKFMICDRGGGFEEVGFRKEPEFYSKKLSDGSLMKAVVQVGGIDRLICCTYEYCEFWTTHDECRYCDISAHTKATRKRGEDRVMRKRPEQLTEAFKEALKDPQFRHTSLTGGTVLGKFHGRTEVELWEEYLNALRDAFPNRVWHPTWVQVAAGPPEEMKRLAETGVGCVHMNLEVWDERLFNLICPGKAKMIGRKSYIDRVIKAVPFFGRGNVLSNFVSGVEMARPWGFDDVSSAIKSTLEGFEYLMQNDVLPRMEIWSVAPHSALAGQSPPPLEYYVELQKGYLELCLKYNFKLPYTGLCRFCNNIDTAVDWAWYYGNYSGG